MDLERMSHEEKLNLCKLYFKIGFAFLPFIWAVNTIWFFSEAFRKPEYDEQREIKKYVILSGIGTLFWLLLLVSWVVVFQMYRASWGEVGEMISFMIPVGRL